MFQQWKVVYPTPSGAMKSMPLNALPPEAWTHLAAAYGGNYGKVVARYKDVPWLRRAVDVCCDAVDSMPYAFVNDKDEDVDDPQFPFDIKQMRRFLNEIEGDLILYGAAYFFKSKNAFRIVKRLQRLHPSTMRPVYSDTNGELLHFERTLNGQQRKLSLDEVGWIWVPNREKELGPGVPRAFTALAAAGVLHFIDVQNEAFFERGAVNPTLVSGEKDNTMLPAEVKKLEDFLRMVATGVQNAFRFVGISRLIQTQQLGYPIKDLAVPELTGVKREDVSTAIGVPHSILFSNATNFATAEADDLHFYDKTIIPDWELIAGGLNEHLFNEYGVSIEPREEDLELYEKMRAVSNREVRNDVKAGLISKEYAREKMGYPEDAAPDEAELALSQPLRFGQPPTQQQPPPNNAKPDDKDEPQQPAKSAFAEDIKKWEQMARKRLKEGKPEKALTFESDNIPETLAASIKGGLTAVGGDAAQIGDVFATALRWDGYYG